MVERSTPGPHWGLAMNFLCLIGQHEDGLVGRGNRWAVKCHHCNRVSKGVAIDGPRPTVTQPKAQRSRIWWLRAVYETKRA